MRQIGDLRDGLADEIDTDVLKCMFKVDAFPFTREIRRFSERDQRDFLSILADQKDLAELVHDEDEDYNLFDDLAGDDFENLVKGSSGNEFP